MDDRPTTHPGPVEQAEQILVEAEQSLRDRVMAHVREQMGPWKPSGALTWTEEEAELMRPILPELLRLADHPDATRDFYRTTYALRARLR